MSSFGYVELRPSAIAEDYSVTITVEGSGSIAGWTLAGKLWDASGTEIPGAVSVAITDAPNRIVTATFAGLSLAALPYYQSHRWEVRRTDTGSRTLVAWGTLEPVDPNPST